jgi:hypothetical protein
MVEPILGGKKTNGVFINFSYLLMVLINFSCKEKKKKKKKTLFRINFGHP